jgi:hypothetical protein
MAKVKKIKINTINFSYFMVVSLIAVFSVFSFVSIPVFNQPTSLRQPQQLVAEQYLSCPVPPIPPGPRAETGPNAGQVTLYWDKVAGADYYNITYGPSSLNYQWGAPNVGNVSQYTVSGLEPGFPYYFIISAVNSCGSSGARQEVAAYAGGQVQSPEKGWQPSPAAYQIIPSPDVYASPMITISPLPEASPSGQATPSAQKQATPAAAAPVQVKSPVPQPTAEPVSFLSDLPGKIIDILSWSKWIIIAIVIITFFAIVGRKLKQEQKDLEPEIEQKPIQTREKLSVKPEEMNTPVTVYTDKGITQKQEKSSVKKIPPQEQTKS